MSNRLTARDFGLTLEKVDGDFETTVGRLALAGVPVFSLSKVRSYQKRVLRKYTKPVWGTTILSLGGIAVITLLVCVAGIMGVLALRWPAEIALISGAIFIGSAALCFMGAEVLNKHSSFSVGSHWRAYAPADVKGIPQEITEREKIVRRLFPKAAVYVEALKLDPFIFVEVKGEDPICFGVWDERKGETYFA